MTVVATPSAFLEMCTALEEGSVKPASFDIFDDDTPLRPGLLIDVTDKVFYVSAHEGRHRAMWIRRKGVAYMTVDLVFTRRARELRPQTAMRIASQRTLVFKDGVVVAVNVKGPYAELKRDTNVSEELFVMKIRKSNEWVAHAKRYAAAHNVTYGRALTLARPSYRAVVQLKTWTAAR